MSDFNTKVIDEFHAKNGVVTDTAPFGDALVVMHTIGAKSGEERVNPAMALPDGDGWLVAASMAGAPNNPAWYHNLVAHPEISVETGDGATIRTIDVTATELTGAERDAAWDRFKEASDGFRQYEERTTRTIPVVKLTPR